MFDSREGRRQQNIDLSVVVDQCKSFPNEIYQDILDNACQSPAMMELYGVKVESQKPCCKLFLSNFINNDIDISEISINTPQKTTKWNEMRKFRVTGSRVYELFTYSRDDWDMKAMKYFFPAKINNKYIKHGIEYEATARESFIEFTGACVVDCGMVISHSNEWLGYSPDGIIFEDGKPTALLEIKCIFEGKISYFIKIILFLDSFFFRKNKKCM